VDRRNRSAISEARFTAIVVTPLPPAAPCDGDHVPATVRSGILRSDQVKGLMEIVVIERQGHDLDSARPVDSQKLRAAGIRRECSIGQPLKPSFSR